MTARESASCPLKSEFVPKVRSSGWWSQEHSLAGDTFPSCHADVPTIITEFAILRLIDQPAIGRVRVAKVHAG